MVYIKADISNEEDIALIEEKAIEAFGGYDTWVNNASVALYSYADDVPIEDVRQLFEINFWGTVYGTRKAVAYFKEKVEPGTIITIGSVTGNRAFPLQTFYSAAKMAIHGFIDGLRME
ncbi:SDR family NAD(P)-dependent oxidoreductase [Alkalibacterium sp. MB6]|uniref:SDR family NAD(P)-dependent oxidoreductase n=1 Tax=Alkalibacterium sp. MB6 TaxID=2081965 RepID=UPI0013798EFB|nr:SDR family NAD(P)-dependent oxidoreductase [Alkalibacterium sp. MB6]